MKQLQEKKKFRGGGLKQGREDKTFYDFILSLFRVQGILYTRIGIDEIDTLSDQTTQLLNEYFSSIDKESNKSGEINKLIHICLTCIFIAHATITDSTKEYSKHHFEQDSSQSNLLTKVLQTHLPTIALKQIGDILLHILDRVIVIPSPWMEAISPLLTWFTLHKDDGLVTVLFEYCNFIPKELARIHKMVSNYCNLELKKIKDDDEQLKVIQLIGTSLLSEEQYFVGFLPLQTYIDSKKQIKSGIKCPPERENLVRSMIIRDQIEDLRCTFDILKQDQLDKEQKTIKGKEEIKETDHIFAQIDNVAAIVLQKVGDKPLIVIDASNAAMRHGKNSLYSVKGIQIVTEYWKKNGHQVICFLPEYLLNYEEISQKKKLQAMNLKDTKSSQLPDNVSLLNKLEGLGLIVKTPSQDYDDSYCIQYAKKTNAYIVTNDKFRDYIQKMEGTPQKGKERKWINDHSISYTFHGDVFLPNPDSKLFEIFSYDGYKNYPLDEL